METLREIINKNDLCFDVGSNMGNKTQKMVDLGAKVISIEPQKECFEYIIKRFHGNNEVTCVNFGCGPNKGKGKIKISSHHTLSTMSEDFVIETSKQRFPGINWEREEVIEILTLDDLIILYGTPKFIKIDVEGYEPDVLRGLSNQVEYLSLEFVPELKYKSFECIEILSSLGNYLFNYSEGESGTFEFSNWIDGDSMKNYLEKNNDFKFSFGDIYAKKI